MTSQRIGAVCVSLLCIVVALGLAPVMLRLPLTIELPNEGWNAVHAMRAFGTALYADPRDGIVNNYPPLWHYLTGALLITFGDPILPGRVISVAAFGATSGAVWWLARTLGATWIAAGLAASWLGAELAAHFAAQIGTSEPQMLASACVVAATALAIEGRSRRVAAIAALLMTVGLGLKHNIIALPLATAAWLAIYRREFFRVWLLTAVCAGAAAGVALVAAYETRIIADLAVPRVLTLGRLWTNLALSFRAIVPLAGLGWLLTRLSWPLDPAVGFAALAVAAGILEILLFGAAQGVSMNIAWDLMIASAVTIAIVWDRVPAMLPPAWTTRFHLMLVLALLARLIGGFPLDSATLVFDREARTQLRDDAAQMVALRERLRAVSDPVACEHLAVCAWAGHASRIDLWKLRFERTVHPVVDTHEILAGIARGQFAAVTLFGRHTGPDEDGNLPGLSAALAACCNRPIYFGSSTLYLRRADR
jgi:hypothetical protein